MEPDVLPMIVNGPFEPMRMLHTERRGRDHFIFTAKAGWEIDSLFLRVDGIIEVNMKRHRGRPWMSQEGGKDGQWRERNRTLH